MWRGARVRPAAIAVLVAGLSTCVPKLAAPPRRVAMPAPEEAEERVGDDHYPCGGVITQLMPEDVVREIEERARRDCSAGAVSGGRHGEVRVVLGPDPVRSPEPGRIHPWMPAVEAEARLDLTEDDRRCVESAARAVLLSVMQEDEKRGIRLEEIWAPWRKDDTLYVALGRPPPLLPPKQELVDRWLAAARGSAARERFRARLPGDVTLTDDGCLSVASRPAFTGRVESWLARVGTPLADHWQRDGQLFSGLAPEGKWMPRRYLAGRGAMLVHYGAAGDRSRQEICLSRFDDALREQLQARVDRSTTCLVGDLRETLLRPRTEFPAGRLFTSVSVGPSRTCAIDDGGALVCCGQRLPEDVPAGPFTSVAVGATFDCGLAADGTLRCWGIYPPAGGADIAGPYARVAVGGLGRMCAVRRDTGVLECWLPAQPRVVTVGPNRVREVTLLDDGMCALLADGRIRCWGPNPFGGSSDIDVRFRAMGASSKSVCGLVDGREEVWCRRGRERLPWDSYRSFPTTQVRAADASDLAVSRDDECVLDHSGRIVCPHGPASHRWDGLYRTIAAGESRVCATTVEGRVQCDRDWPDETPSQPPP